MKTACLLIIALLLVTVGVNTTRADAPMLDRVPADALLYVGFCGGKALTNELKLLEQLSDEVASSTCLNAFVHRVMGTYNAAGEPFADQAQLLVEIAVGLRDYPTGFYVTGFAQSASGAVYHRLGFLADAGEEAQAAVQRLEPLQHSAARMKLPLTVTREGTVVKVLLGESSPHTQSLAELPHMAHLRSPDQLTPFVWVYINSDALLDTVATIAPKINDTLDKRIRHTIAASNLDQVDGVFWTAGMQQGQWTTHLFVASPGLRNGWMRGLNARKIDRTLLEVIPSDASMVGALQTRPHQVVAAAHTLLEWCEPAATSRLLAGKQMIQNFTGDDPQQKLAQAMGEQWVYYATTNAPTHPVAINQLRDAPQFVTWLTSCLAILAGDQQRGVDGVRVTQLQNNEASLWSIQTNGVKLVLAVHEDYLLAGTSIDAVIDALSMMREPTPSLLDDEAFQRMVLRLDADRSAAFWYSDLRHHGSWTTNAWRVTDRLYQTLAAKAGVHAPALPNVGKAIADRLGPVGAFARSDEHGFYVTTSTPFPGATLLARTITGAYWSGNARYRTSPMPTRSTAPTSGA